MWWLVLAANLLEDCAPDAFRRTQHTGYEILAGIGGHVSCGGTTARVARIGDVGAPAGDRIFGLGLAARYLDTTAGECVQEVNAEKQLGGEIDQHKNDDGR